MSVYDIQLFWICWILYIYFNSAASEKWIRMPLTLICLNKNYAFEWQVHPWWCHSIVYILLVVINHYKIKPRLYIREMECNMWRQKTTRNIYLHLISNNETPKAFVHTQPAAPSLHSSNGCNNAPEPTPASSFPHTSGSKPHAPARFPTPLLPPHPAPARLPTPLAPPHPVRASFALSPPRGPPSPPPPGNVSVLCHPDSIALFPLHL